MFDFMEPGEELVHEPFQRLIERNLLPMHKYEGFWAPMDTLKDRSDVGAARRGRAPPWAVWEKPRAGPRHQGSVVPPNSDALSSSG